MNKQININCDLGEGMGNDVDLMQYLDSCNIACGGHFGDAKSMRDSIELAIKYNVKVGAHPSFPDKQNFGRKILQIPRDELQQSLFQQISEFIKQCEQMGVEMHHIKLHGALYNLATIDVEIAALVLNVCAALKPEIKIYVPYNSAIAVLAEDYFHVVFEAFIDRRYHQDLSLVSRTQNNAVISNVEEAWQQLNQIIRHGTISSVEGKKVIIKADTFCVHGDEKNALMLLKHIRKCLSS